MPDSHPEYKNKTEVQSSGIILPFPCHCLLIFPVAYSVASRQSQDLKEAISHYCMYRWYSARISTADYAALNHLKQEREFHLAQFQVLSLKSKNLELPDIATLENLTNIRNRMVSVTTAFETGFNNINSAETIAY